MTYPQQPYGQQPYYPQQPPQPYGQPPQFQPPQPQPQQPAQPLAKGTLDAFYSQPSTGNGPDLKNLFKDAMGQPVAVGTSVTFTVTRDVTDADIQQQLKYNSNIPDTYNDGRPKLYMKVPVTLTPNPDPVKFPEGTATWYVKGRLRDELSRAMQAAGQSGAPQGGAQVVLTFTGLRPIKNLSPEWTYSIVYTAPANVAPAAPAPVAPVPPAAPAVVSTPAPAPAAAPANPAIPAGLTPEQFALIQQMTGQQAS